MTTHMCWICSTPIYQIIPKFLQMSCVCGEVLGAHCLAPPHPMPSVSCPGFTPVPGVTPTPPTTDARPALF
jgi:hypothetical protein